MQWETMSRKDAHDFLLNMKTDKDFFRDNIDSLRFPTLSGTYKDIHDRLLSAFRTTMSLKDSKVHHRSWEYDVDLDMAESIYCILSDYGFTPRDASNEEIWIHLSLKVIPDIIVERFGKKGFELPHDDRFYANPRRVYPSMLWWYFYLAMPEDSENTIVRTKEILSLNQSDDISQLIERASSDGYPVSLYKSIMNEYHNRLTDGRKPGNLLSRVLALNIVRMESVEPELTGNGVDSYVVSLFDEVDK